MKILLVVVLSFFANLVAAEFDSLANLGKALYFDKNLSKNRTQACATCHAPEAGFVDPRTNASGKAVSLGDDGKSLGDRNAPTVAYTAFSPSFHKTQDGKYVGGQFLDGREKDLAGQAGGPPLNPIEMAMPDKKSVIARIRQNHAYVATFRKFYGANIFSNVDDAYFALTQAIAKFEKTDFFAPFDSKYDRYLRGEYELTTREDLGMTLFFSQQFTNCNLCHQLRKSLIAKDETFSNYEYHNIGTPINIKARQANGIALTHKDKGLLENPAVNDKSQAGKFKVPTLRNVAITGPYMHNGVFKDLRTVVLFYNKYNSKSAKRQINPETQQKWREPEIAENISIKELETGPALDDKRIDALVAFMKLLTDKRYEHFLQE